MLLKFRESPLTCNIYHLNIYDVKVQYTIPFVILDIIMVVDVVCTFDTCLLWVINSLKENTCILSKFLIKARIPRRKKILYGNEITLRRNNCRISG